MSSALVAQSMEHDQHFSKLSASKNQGTLTSEASSVSVNNNEPEEAEEQQDSDAASDDDDYDGEEDSDRPASARVEFIPKE